MQDYLFFVTASYGAAAVILSSVLLVTVWQYLRTRKRYNALVQSSNDGNNESKA